MPETRPVEYTTAQGGVIKMAKRKCKHCKEYVETWVTLPVGTFCTVDHAMLFAGEVRKKQQAKQLAKVKRDNLAVEKVKRAKHKEAKERVKPKAKWLAELQAVFNKYVRLRDSHLGCISCDKPKDWQGQWHASHYYSRGHSSALRFNLWNVHKSCSVCNSHLSGNIGEYTPAIIEKIGQERFDYLLKHKSDITNFDIEWIKRAIKITKKAIKRVEERRPTD
jgi:hypothetical protein